MAEKNQYMTDDELASICGQMFEDSRLMTEVAQDREDALSAYNCELYGNEMTGLSKFVTSDVRDVVEWILPQLVDIFYGSDLPVVFVPENAEDVEQAEIETQYCRNVFENQNQGFLVTYTWFKDALLSKNGIVKCYWDEKVIQEREEYRDKDEMEYNSLLQDPDFTVDQVTVVLGGGDQAKDMSLNEYKEFLNQFTDLQAIATIQQGAKWHIVGYRRRDVSQVCIENVAPELFFISRDHNSPDPQKAPYTAEVFTKTRSELIEEGFDKDLVMGLTRDFTNLSDFSQEAATRFRKEGTNTLQTNEIVDPATEKLILVAQYIRVDFDGDGVAEMRYVLTNGVNGEVLENVEVDRNIYHSITPYINTHKFYGRSIADNLTDIQKLKTQITRAALDNLTYAVAPRKKIKGSVNTADLMDYVPGGIIRMGQDGDVMNDETPFVGDKCVAVINFADSMRAERTGFSQNSMGLNPQSLANSTDMVGMMIMNQSQLLTKMIASIFANTGFSSLMLHIRELCAKYEKKERIFDVAGKWVPVDPRQWRKKRSSTVRTGIGYAAKSERLATLTSLLNLTKEIAVQQGGIEGPLTSADGVYKLISDIGKATGTKDAGAKYFRDPATYQPPQPAPTVADITLKLKTEELANQQTRAEAELLQKQQQFIQKMQMEQEQFDAKLAQDDEHFDRELMFKYGESARKQETDMISKAMDRVTEPKEPKEEEDDE